MYINLSKLNKQWQGVVHRVDPGQQVSTTPSLNHIKDNKQKDKIDTHTHTIYMEVWGKYDNNYKSNIKFLDKIMHSYEYEVIIIKASSDIAMKEIIFNNYKLLKHH